MTILTLIEKIKSVAADWKEVLEPPATTSEIKIFADKIRSLYSMELPVDYLQFLEIINGLEFNGLIIYGTKNSELDPDGSPLDLIEMNEVMRDSLRADMVVFGENSTGIIVYDNTEKQFQYRDRIGIDRIEPYSSFEEILKIEIEKVM